MNAATARDDHEDIRERRASSHRRASRPAATSTDTLWIARLVHRTATGTERASDGCRDEPPMTPASDSEGCGACTCEVTATPTVAMPAAISSTPVIPATRARRPTGTGGGGAYPVCGQETTTRNPAIRRHGASGTVAVPSSAGLLH